MSAPHDILRSGMLHVGQGHSIYYETYGNPRGKTVLFLHGGPGLGISERDRRFFDPKVYHAILFDQRGAGRSRPSASLEHNTTADLLGDIDLLFDHLGVKSAILFGGSWGSALALLYAMRRPEKVKILVLRGFFPVNKRCRAHFEQGGTAPFYPEAWQRYIDLVPEQERDQTVAYYFKMMHSTDAALRRKYAFELAYYGIALSKRQVVIEDIPATIKSMPFEKKIRIQAHYCVNDFFIPDNYIYNHLDKVCEIPTYIIHGRYDMICPFSFAYELHRGLRHSKLYITDAGHAASDPENEKMLLQVMAELKTL